MSQLLLGYDVSLHKTFVVELILHVICVRLILYLAYVVYIKRQPVVVYLSTAFAGKFINIILIL